MSPTAQPPLTLVERVLALGRTEAFRSVPPEPLSHLAAVAKETTVPEGRVVFGEGTTPDAFYVILSGRLRLDHAGRRVAEAGADEAVGVWALFSEAPRPATATSEEPTRMLVVDRDAFFEVLADHMEITRALVSDLVSRLTRLSAPAQSEGKEG